MVDSVSFLVSAALLRSIPVVEPAPEPNRRRRLLREVAEGARWVYTHEMVAPMAIWSHAWFFAQRHTLDPLLDQPQASRRIGDRLVAASKVRVGYRPDACRRFQEPRSRCCLKPGELLQQDVLAVRAGRAPSGTEPPTGQLLSKFKAINFHSVPPDTRTGWLEG